MRIQLELDEPGMELVEEMKRLTGSRTYRDLFNNALSLLDWSVRQQMAGRKITSVDAEDSNTRELAMPALHYAEALAHKAQPAAKESKGVMLSQR